MKNYTTDRVEDLMLELIHQDDRDPFWFRFFFKPGHPKSEEFKEWFELHCVKYTVFEQNQEGGIQDACVDFNKTPDLAVLFKLRFG